MAPTYGQRRTEQLRKRMQLEAQLEGSLRTEFNRVVREYRRNYRATGSEGPELIAQHRTRLATLLEASYRRSARRFKGDAAVELRVPERTDTEFRDLVDASLEAWSRQTAFTVSGYISVTTQNNVRQSVQRAVSIAAEAGETLDQATTALQSSQVLQTILRNRAEGIAVSETTNGVETTKLTEVQAYAGEVPEVGRNLGLQPVDPVQGAVRKRWQTILDGRERQSHRDANGQTVPLDQPFVVQGENLMYPRDSSMGASLNNIIGCRCSTRYVREG